MAGRYKQHGRGPPIKAGQHEPYLHFTICEIHHIYENLNESSSARPGRSQQLEIPQSLNSKRAACFSSPAGFSSDAGFSSNAGFLPGAGMSKPARILLSACFSANERISQSACFQQKQGFLNPPDFQQTRGFLNPLYFFWLQVFVRISDFVFCILY
jgi:hypothetical protein